LTTDEVWTPFAPGELRLFVDGSQRPIERVGL
jgi:hypothetical protein